MLLAPSAIRFDTGTRIGFNGGGGVERDQWPVLPCAMVIGAMLKNTATSVQSKVAEFRTQI
jgi:hypothetical protein